MKFQQQFCLLFCLIFALTIAKPFPKIPQDFSVDIEFHSLKENHTFNIHEHYDYTHKRVSWETHSHNHTIKHIFLSDKNEHFIIDEQANTCVRRHGQGFANSNGHMKTSQELFGIANVQSVEYTGVKRTRNILCDTWRTLNVTNHGSTTFTSVYHFHFAIAEWKWRGTNEHQVPVRIEYNITANNGTSSKQYMFTADYVHFIHDHDELHDGEFKIPKKCYEPFPDIPLPTLPDEFSTTISATNIHNNSTFSVTEYYSKPQGRARMDFFWNGKWYESFYDTPRGYHYLKEKYSFFHCHVQKLQPGTRWIDEHGHLIGPSQLFQFGKGFSEKYMGVETVRGIECDHWHGFTQRMNNRLNIMFNYTIQYSFSVQSWHLPNAGEHRIPVRAIFKGVPADGSRKELEFHQIFEFTDFQAGLPMFDVDGRHGIWHVPSRCLAEVSPIKFPQLPPSFATDVEVVLPFLNRTFVFSEWVDTKNEKLRIDIHGDESNKNSTIMFIKSKKKLHIVNGQKCTVSTLNTTGLVHDNHMKTTQELFRFGPDFKEKYLGVHDHLVNGFNCDRWFIEWNGTWREHTNHYWTLEHYFVQKDWSIDGGTQHRVPVRAVLLGYPKDQNGKISEHAKVALISNFMSFHSDLDEDEDAFDIPEPCSSTDAPLLIVMGISGGIASAGSLFGVVLGSVAGFFIGWLVYARRLGQSKSTIPRQMTD